MPAQLQRAAIIAAASAGSMFEVSITQVVGVQRLVVEQCQQLPEPDAVEELPVVSA